MATKRRTPQSTGEAPGAAAGAVGPPDAELTELLELLELLQDTGAPAKIIAALEGASDPEQIFEQLFDSGSLPPFEEAIDDLMGGWTDLLDEECGPLDAELAGVGFLGLLRDHVSGEAEQLELLEQLIEQAEALASPEALAMLRVLSAMGPAQLRPAAVAGADRLCAQGLSDCAWVADLGVPKVGRGFGYADMFGLQEAVAMTFSYGRRRHALVALIDHDLGGGVKDVWVSDRPDRIRAQYKKATEADGLRFRNYSAAEVSVIVTQALGKEPCPAEPDQVEDVRDFIDLLGQRVALLTGGASGTARSRGVARQARPSARATERFTR